MPLLKSVKQLLLQRPRSLALFFVPLGIDLLVENTAMSRLVTGVIASFPTAVFVRVAAEQLQERFLESATSPRG